MGSILKTAAAIGALTLTLGSAAEAADMRRPYPPAPPLPPPPVQSAPMPVDEFTSGWYLRGDIGYRFNKTDGVSNAATAAAVQVRDDDLDRSWLIGVGAGYKWQWFRTDLTLDYATKANYSGTTTRMVDDFTAKVDSFSVLANIYGDLGTWWGLTPYIGAGVGTARLSTTEFEQNFLAAVPAVESSKWNFAWAYMAGVSYKVSSNFHVDLGYRHIDMGDITTGRDTYGNQLTLKSVAADEVRLGVRYFFD